MADNSWKRFFNRAIPNWVVYASLAAGAAAGIAAGAAGNEITTLKEMIADLTSDDDALRARLDKIERAKESLRGFGLDYYGLANLDLMKDKDRARRVIFYGDSITEFWQLPQFFRNLPYRFVNRGIKAQETEHLLARSYFDVLMLKPWAVVLTAGTNDALKGVSAERIEGNLDILIYTAHRRGAIVFVGTLPSVRIDDPRKRRIEASVDSVNSWIRRRCGDKSCTVLDFNAALKRADKASKDGAFKDGVHPNDDGYAAMAKLVRDALKGAGG